MKATLDNLPRTPTLDDAEPLLDIEQAARLLNVSETSLRRWTNDGRLACLRVGRRRERRFRKLDLLAFMESEPAGPVRPRPDAHGVHLCGLYSSDEGQVKQVLAFFSEGFPPRSAAFLVGGAETRARVLVALEREHPGLDQAISDGRLLHSDYAGSAAAQLVWWETHIEEAVRRGATSIRITGDAGGFAKAASREELLDYEAEFDRRITQRFPGVLTMCQYDVRLFSGLVVLDALKAHPHSFGHPAERILA